MNDPGTIVTVTVLAALVVAGVVVGLRRRRQRRDMVFGMEVILDVDGCNPDVITDPEVLRWFALEIVHSVGMNPYGTAWLAHFGHGDPVTSGYTLFQPLETSSFTGHFSDHLRRAHLNLFSCRPFDPDKVAALCAEALGGTVAQQQVVVR